MGDVLAYGLEFRGQATQDGDELVVGAGAPSCVHETRVEGAGVTSSYVFDEDAGEALLDSRVALDGNGVFTAVATIDFGHGHRLFLRTGDNGRLDGSADRHLRHGTAVFQVVGGTGQFDGASGRVTSNFVLSDTGDVTDNHFGMIFLRRLPRRSSQADGAPSRGR